MGGTNKDDESMVKKQDPASVTYVDIVAELSKESAERLGEWEVGSLKTGEHPRSFDKCLQWSC
jgi:hypothetical protein